MKVVLIISMHPSNPQLDLGKWTQDPIVGLASGIRNPGDNNSP